MSYDNETHFLSTEEVAKALKKAKLDPKNPLIVKTVNALLDAVSDKLDDGVSVSVDVSQGDDDAFDRIFAVSCGFQITHGSHGDIDILSVKESQNF